MANGYTFGNKFFTDLAKRGGQYYQIGRVKSIILGPSDEGYESPADIGKITYGLLYSPIDTSLSGPAIKWLSVKCFSIIFAPKEAAITLDCVEGI